MTTMPCHSDISVRFLALSLNIMCVVYILYMRYTIVYVRIFAGYITLFVYFRPQSFLTTLNITHILPFCTPFLNTNSHLHTQRHTISHFIRLRVFFPLLFSVCSPFHGHVVRPPTFETCTLVVCVCKAPISILDSSAVKCCVYKRSPSLPFFTILILLPLLSTFSWLTSTTEEMLTLNVQIYSIYFIFSM